MINPNAHQHVFGTEILRCEVGSTAHGTGVPGTDDRDEMAIVVPPKEMVLGLNQFDNYVYRDAAIRTGRGDAKSEPGDLDLTLYSLRKFLGLARKGNPSILMMFFAPVVHADRLGHLLRLHSGLFQSKEAGFRFVGYMKAQRERLAGERGQKRINRPDLIEQFGFDTKYAYHIIRLGIQGLQFVKTGRISVPLPEHIRDLLLAIRTGQYTQEKVLQWADELEVELRETLEESALPETAPVEPIDALSVELHEAIWAEQENLIVGVDI